MLKHWQPDAWDWERPDERTGLPTWSVIRKSGKDRVAGFTSRRRVHTLRAYTGQLDYVRESPVANTFRLWLLLPCARTRGMGARNRPPT